MGSIHARVRVAVLSIFGTLLLAVLPATAAGASTAPSVSVFEFPSASSTVVASIGFINSTEVGYFWSASRGDMVEQTFSGPASVNGAILKATVVENVLNGGNHVDWALNINGITVGRFRVPTGFIGTLTVAKSFAPISGPSYDVQIKVLNEVPGGGGSITLAYAGSSPHGVVLRGTP